MYFNITNLKEKIARLCRSQTKAKIKILLMILYDWLNFFFNRIIQDEFLLIDVQHLKYRWITKNVAYIVLSILCGR